MELMGVRVVLVNTRFPENVGMAVRACANMGCSELTLVAPERWIPEKAAPLATPKGQPLLGRVRVVDDLVSAIGDCQCTIATTARIGGWRRALLSPGEAAGKVVEACGRGEKVALVFGSEDRGLENSQIEVCQHITTIPTSGTASSLNLAQAVLILLYECAGALRREQHGDPDRRRPARGSQGQGDGRITTGDTERLMEHLERALLRLDVLHGNNPDYFLMPWRRLFARAELRRHEYDAFMGLCRQILSRVPEKEGKK